MRIVERLMQTRNLLAAMILLQVVWLVMRWFLMAAPDWRQLSLLLVYTIAGGVVIGRMPAGFVSRIRRLKEGLIRNDKLVVLTLCVVLLIGGVIYAHYPRVSPDEVRNFEASRMVAVEGVAPFFTDYGQIPWLGEQHPPLVPLVYGFAMRLLGVNLFVVRFISLVLGLGIVLITYFLGSELYDRYTGFLAAFLLLSFPFFLRMGALANNDMPVTFCFSLALLLTLHLLRTPTYHLSVAVGLFIGAGLLSKYTMVLIYPVLLSYFAVNGPFRRLKFHLGIVILVSVAMVATWLVYAHHIGVLATQGNVIARYAGVGTTTDGGLRLMTKWRIEAMLEALLTRLPSALGAYSIPMLLLGGLHLVGRRTQPDLFILLWTATVFLLVILTLPDPRYFMPAFPALAIAMARGLTRIPEATEQVVVLALFYCGEALYLYIVLNQAARLFLR